MMDKPVMRATDAQPAPSPTLPTLPPGGRSGAALGLTSAAAEGRLSLQVCRRCGQVQYPPREACRACLSDELDWRDMPGDGTLLAETLIRRPYEAYHRARAPWRTGLVRLDAGVVVVAFLHRACAAPPSRVVVRACLDRAGQAVLAALPDDHGVAMNDDPMLAPLGNSPRGRRILITDGASPLGLALARELAEAGAAALWLGTAAASPLLPPIPGVSINAVPLDVTSAASVDELADAIGPEVDILVSNAEAPPSRAMDDHGEEEARAAMETSYFGLMRLARAFAPTMSARGGGDAGDAVAWVNLLSADAFAAPGQQSGKAASQAAALALSRSLRARFAPAGIRVLNLFPALSGDPASLARATVTALESGVEDLYPDHVSRELHRRWRADPKALERALRG